MNFVKLTDIVISVNNSLQAKAKSAVNMTLTIRNWLIGYYIVEFEQNGEDRAAYGSELLSNLSQSITKKNIDGFSVTNLRLFRQFYNTATDESKKSENTIHQSVTDELQNTDNQVYKNNSLKLPEDNPPIGILLCTKAKPQMVHYATVNRDNILVKEYRVQLPDENELQKFIEQQVKEL